MAQLASTRRQPHPSHRHHRVLRRGLVSVTALAGLAGAFLVGTSFGGSGGAQPWSVPGAGSDASPAAYTDSDLELPGSCDDLLASYVRRGVDQVGPWGWGGYAVPMMLGDGMSPPTAGEEFSSGSASGSRDQSATAAQADAPLPTTTRATNEESGTNVQEAGVDEPDIVKTDGRTLFRVEDGELVTYDVSGADVVRLGSTDLPGGHAGGTDILLSEDTVVAISQSGGSTGYDAGFDTTYPGAGRGSTVVSVLDVTDPSAPRVTHTATYDTGLVTARMHEGVVRLVLQLGLPDLDFTQPDDHTTDHEAIEANQGVVRDSTIDDWLPTVVYDGGAAEPLADCSAIAVPHDDAPLGTLAVVGFDAPAPQAPSVSGLALDSDLVYASTDRLFVATSPYAGVVVDCFECNEPVAPLPMPGALGDLGRGLIPHWIPGSGTEQEQGTSHLYDFDLDGLDTTFVADGTVDGAIRDRWSMDEHDGVLRVAVGPTAATGGFNSVVTFTEQGNDLVESGRLDHLGAGQEIESVRWFDDLAILVTFRQTDPLYAVDLSDPAAPTLMGQLEIPGFSAYLHPLGEHRLLGLGEGPAANGAWGAQAGLFDVTDLTHPTRLDVLSYGPGTQALAAQDPRQLTWLPDGRTVLSVVADYGRTGGETGYVSVLQLGDGALANRMVEVEHGADVTSVRLVPLADGRVVLVTGEGASFFTL